MHLYFNLDSTLVVLVIVSMFFIKVIFFHEDSAVSNDYDHNLDINKSIKNLLNCKKEKSI